MYWFTHQATVQSGGTATCSAKGMGGFWRPAGGPYAASSQSTVPVSTMRGARTPKSSSASRPFDMPPVHGQQLRVS